VQGNHRTSLSLAWVPREDDDLSGREDGLFRLGKTNYEGKDADRGLPSAGIQRFGPSRVVSNPCFSSVCLFYPGTINGVKPTRLGKNSRRLLLFWLGLCLPRRTFQPEQSRGGVGWL